MLLHRETNVCRLFFFFFLAIVRVSHRLFHILYMAYTAKHEIKTMIFLVTPFFLFIFAQYT